MQTKKFSRDFVIHYHEVDAWEQASPLTMLYYLEDAAIAHSESAGYGTGRLREEALAWLLKRWCLHVDRYPRFGETVRIETWPSNFERFYGRREFLVWNKDREVIAKATSLWIFYNAAAKRPSRIRPEFGELYSLDPLRAIDDPFLALHSIGPDGRADSEKEFAVRYSDIDTNWHVNNAHYLQWMLEAMPEEVYRNYEMASLEIQYTKETTYGSQIRARSLIEDAEDGPGVVQHVILDRDSDKELASGRTVWRKRQS